MMHLQKLNSKKSSLKYSIFFKTSIQKQRLLAYLDLNKNEEIKKFKND